ncbi:MAG: alpha/beta hydrolase [Anaerolineaceae bacterium]|nr:alpha/beta hydrolase [Anaerolineaceae bacterium]
MNFSQMLKFTFLLTRLRAHGMSKKVNKVLPGGVLDPQTALLRQMQGFEGKKPLYEKNPIEARNDLMLDMMLYRRFSGPVAQIPNVWNLAIPSPEGEIPARAYMPAGEGPFPLLLLFHGGGWVLGNLNLADNTARTLCHYGKCSVLSVDYRLAPEHPYPAGLDDCYTALEWAARPENAAKLRASIDQIIVGGDSAGGNLSAAVCLKARDQNGPKIAHQLLIYPATNLRDLDTLSYQQFGTGAGLDKKEVEWFINHYLPRPDDAKNPYVSPLLAESLAGLPPATILTAEFDVLRDEGEAYAKRLQAAGVEAAVIRANGLTHGFLSVREMIKRADLYIKRTMNTMRAALLTDEAE